MNQGYFLRCPYIKKKRPTKEHLVDRFISGGRGGIRTRDLRLRRPTLYPAELPAQSIFKIAFATNLQTPSMVGLYKEVLYIPVTPAYGKKSDTNLILADRPFKSCQAIANLRARRPCLADKSR